MPEAFFFYFDYNHIDLEKITEEIDKVLIILAMDISELNEKLRSPIYKICIYKMYFY